MGRKQNTIVKEDEKIVKIAKNDNNATSSTIQQEISREGVNISAQTVRRYLKEARGKYNQPVHKPLLLNNHMKKQLQWAREHIDFDWKNVIFTDKSTFILYLLPKKVWNFPEKKKSSEL